jgi:hypothetical protein
MLVYKFGWIRTDFEIDMAIWREIDLRIEMLLCENCKQWLRVNHCVESTGGILPSWDPSIGKDKQEHED